MSLMIATSGFPPRGRVLPWYDHDYLYGFLQSMNRPLILNNKGQWVWAGESGSGLVPEYQPDRRVKGSSRYITSLVREWKMLAYATGGCVQLPSLSTKEAMSVLTNNDPANPYWWDRWASGYLISTFNKLGLIIVRFLTKAAKAFKARRGFYKSIMGRFSLRANAPIDIDLPDDIIAEVNKMLIHNF